MFDRDKWQNTPKKLKTQYLKKQHKSISSFTKKSNHLWQNKSFQLKSKQNILKPANSHAQSKSMSILIQKQANKNQQQSYKQIKKLPKQRSNSLSTTKPTPCPLIYNKWFIPAPYRMRPSINLKKHNPFQNSQSTYNSLSEQYLKDDQNPFKMHKNQKLEGLDSLSSDNVTVLMKFKRALQQKQRRIPKVVSVFIHRKNQKAK